MPDRARTSQPHSVKGWRALQGKVDAAKACETAGKAAAFNGLNFNYGFVREKAKKLASA